MHGIEIRDVSGSGWPTLRSFFFCLFVATDGHYPTRATYGSLLFKLKWPEPKTCFFPNGLKKNLFLVLRGACVVKFDAFAGCLPFIHSFIQQPNQQQLNNLHQSIMFPVFKNAQDRSLDDHLPQELHANNIVIQNERKGETAVDWIWRHRLASQFFEWMKNTLVAVRNRHEILRFEHTWRCPVQIADYENPLLLQAGEKVCAALSGLGYHNPSYHVNVQDTRCFNKRVTFSVICQPSLNNAVPRE